MALASRSSAVAASTSARAVRFPGPRLARSIASPPFLPWQRTGLRRHGGAGGVVTLGGDLVDCQIGCGRCGSAREEAGDDTYDEQHGACTDEAESEFRRRVGTYHHE